MKKLKNIYELDIKEMRNALRSFGNCTYGQTVALLAFFPPFLCFVLQIIAIVNLANNAGTLEQSAFVLVTLLFVISFIQGNRYFYRELREFLAYKAS